MIKWYTLQAPFKTYSIYSQLVCPNPCIEASQHSHSYEELSWPHLQDSHTWNRPYPINPVGEDYGKEYTMKAEIPNTIDIINCKVVIFFFFKFLAKTNNVRLYIFRLNELYICINAICGVQRWYILKHTCKNWKSLY